MVYLFYFRERRDITYQDLGRTRVDIFRIETLQQWL